MSRDLIWVGLTLAHTQAEDSGATAAAAHRVATQTTAPHTLPVKSQAAAGAAHDIFKSALMSPEQTVGVDLADLIQGGSEQETCNMAWEKEREGDRELEAWVSYKAGFHK